jgi:hypothetical protein
MSDVAVEHVNRSSSILLNGPIDEVFPLFAPVREAEWAHGWAIRVLHAETDLLEEEGAVFTTHLHDDLPTIWITTRYDPAAHHIEYARLTPESRATMVKIRCEAEGKSTRAHVTYEITALNEHGNQYVQDFTETAYGSMMEHWEKAINHRMRTGKSLSHP